jgi:hypothetical protein
MTIPINEPERLGDPSYRARNLHIFGRRLLTTVIDERARRHHGQPYASIPVSASPSDGYRDITYAHFAKAIDKCAWWIKSQLSTSDRFEPLIYLGAFDLRYQILAMAAVKTGHVVSWSASIRLSRFSLTSWSKDVLHIASKQPGSSSVSDRRRSRH